MIILLDRRRPYATVHGIASHKYEQDGLTFDVHGNNVDHDGNIIDIVVRTPPPEKITPAPEPEPAARPAVPDGFPCMIGTCTFIGKNERALKAHIGRAHGVKK